MHYATPLPLPNPLELKLYRIRVTTFISTKLDSVRSPLLVYLQKLLKQQP